MNQMEDQDIIQRVLQGEQTAFAGLIQKYQGRVFQLCISMLSDYREAEDAAQEIFVKVFYALNRFKGQSSFYTWLYRIASNHCLDVLRKKSRHRSESLDQLIENKGDEIERLLSRGKKSDEVSYDQEIVHHALSLLAPDYRLILTLRELEGMTYDEIADSLRCSRDAVKGRLKRARRDFKKIIQPFLDRQSV